MKFFIDTADVNELRAARDLGCVDGVTTTASEETLRELCSIVDAPVSVQAVSVTAPALISEGRQLAKLHPNLVLTIPMSLEGLKAVKALADEGFRTNVTRCFSANQALLCMKAGATFISTSDEALLRDLVTLVRNFGSKSQVVASARKAEHVLQAALLGVDAVSLPFELLLHVAQQPAGASWS